MDSKLQIISGTLRGYKLHLPPDARPTQNRARIALFNMINSIIDFNSPFIVWDAFAGSGAFGIECISRYNNANVIFTDISDTSIKTLKKNLAGTKLDTAKHTVNQIDAITGIKQYGNSTDLLFLDPPYDIYEFGLRFLHKFGLVAKQGTIVIQEIESNVKYAPDEKMWRILRDKTYGRARFLILERI